ncbi:MAG: hypothetical protein KKF54_06790 [Candidatus Omnitrophica bacterium]|nr:hypothetical protein [Candidatus Omnitrophota bacterium]
MNIPNPAYLVKKICLWDNQLWLIQSAYYGNKNENKYLILELVDFSNSYGFNLIKKLPAEGNLLKVFNSFAEAEKFIDTH